MSKSPSQMRACLLFVLASSLTAVAGCKDRSNTGVHLRGKVEYQGFPIPRGLVFVTNAGDGKFVSMGPILNGTYEVSGLSRGEYLLGVSSSTAPEELIKVLPTELVDDIMKMIRANQAGPSPGRPGGGEGPPVRPRGMGGRAGKGGPSGKGAAPPKEGAGQGKKFGVRPDIAEKFKDVSATFADPKKAGIPPVSVGSNDTVHDIILK